MKIRLNLSYAVGAIFVSNLVMAQMPPPPPPPPPIPNGPCGLPFCPPCCTSAPEPKKPDPVPKPVPVPVPSH